MDVAKALRARHSVRAFANQPIPRDLLVSVLESAQRAPSWCNIQPWRLALTSGAATDRLRAALVEAAKTQAPNPETPFPAIYPPPYDEHRKNCGKVLYSAMGIPKEDKAARWGAWLRNYELFDAPHAAIVSMDRSFGVYGALDVGCWLQSFLLALTEAGLAACPQASLATYPDVVRKLLDIPASEHILFGISFGYEKDGAPANRAITDRAPIAANVRFFDE